MIKNSLEEDYLKNNQLINVKRVQLSKQFSNQNEANVDLIISDKSVVSLYSKKRNQLIDTQNSYYQNNSINTNQSLEGNTLKVSKHRSSKSRQF